MRKLILAAAPLVLAGAPAAPALADHHGHAGGAHAMLKSADGQARGMAMVSEAKGGLKVHVMAEGVAAGVHGIHIHTVGKCDGPDFATAGGHWNPTAHAHGRDNPKGAHQGDLPNITIGADGKGMIDFTVPGGKLADLLDADGAAVVIHAAPDDYKTDPSGNSGGRIACGVLAKK